ncbi:MAG: FKBP-type peptidyl-prolyl cis-trans isomerase [Bacteroidia bacterium]|nr:FKBP-type peptidyl-prolyl cis-trans isomerase [Bacteroidia bacterium]
MPITKGSRVTVHYKLQDEHGLLLKESEEPLSFTVGEGQILPAFEEALFGRNTGDIHTFTLSPEQAFGTYRPELVFRVQREQLQGDLSEPIQVGEVFQLYTSDSPEDPPVIAYVSAVDLDTVELDANHPLAGKSLTYTVTILNVE